MYANLLLFLGYLENVSFPKALGMDDSKMAKNTQFCSACSLMYMHTGFNRFKCYFLHMHGSVVRDVRFFFTLLKNGTNEVAGEWRCKSFYALFHF
ncbi:hypothetical protein L6452_35698 [Arctium lappa]|uniref:Uncharacterized protein n=1 Tax=Arctium lappa TaxID=4217 RepID=A0ACB8Y899_ARCLA|nr:hypothetical protein L6452_35698 [Arctium lappa]